jgi:hypothetical protein
VILSEWHPSDIKAGRPLPLCLREERKHLGHCLYVCADPHLAAPPQLSDVPFEEGLLAVVVAGPVDRRKASPPASSLVPLHTNTKNYYPTSISLLPAYRVSALFHPAPPSCLHPDPASTTVIPVQVPQSGQSPKRSKQNRREGLQAVDGRRGNEGGGGEAPAGEAGRGRECA